jgi:hypothetical protein
MRRLRVWLLGVGGMFRKKRRDSEFIAELESHLLAIYQGLQNARRIRRYLFQ